MEGDLKESQQVQETPEKSEGGKGTLTIKRFEYQPPFKKKNYQEALIKLRHCVDQIDTSWADAKNTSALRQMRAELEENRQTSEKNRVDFVPFVLEEELQLVNSESSDIMKQTVDLRKKVGV